MALAGVGFAVDSLPLLLAVLFLMGMQSTFFGPAKYSILPELLGERDLVGGNALVAGATFLAILLGTITGGLVIAGGDVWVSRLGFMVVMVAVAGYLTSRFILKTPPADPDLEVRLNPVTPTIDILRVTYFNKSSEFVNGVDLDLTYRFPAMPWGMQLYHCHAAPLKKHIHKGLYGAFIIDPATPRPPAQELVMVMNGYDTDGDGANNFYSVNGPAFFHAKHPIRVKRSETVRIYLANLTEFDLINSFHLHGEFFRYYRTGSTDQFEYTDTVMLCQGERGIVEIDFHNPGLFMFHAHQSEFAELGWMGYFDVQDA